MSQREVEEVRNLERESSVRVTPWGRPLNLGVEECLRRRFVLAALTSPSFKWPPGPYAVLKIGDRVVGVVDERGIAIDRYAIAGAKGDRMIVFLPLRIPELEGISEDCVAASPSLPTHEYLLRVLGGCRGCGTLLIGLNDLKVMHSEGL